jgi:two-component sensor histidine kinase
LDKISLTLDAAVPCGLIINELVSNSLKYAFPDGRDGEIRINLKSHPAGKAMLIIADNGIGLRSDIDWETTRSLGLRLVRSLARQLTAELEVRTQPGTEVQLTFSTAA